MNDLHRPRDAGDLLERLDQLNRIGAALSQERDITKLIELIVVAAKRITNADGGTLYRMTEDPSVRQGGQARSLHGRRLCRAP